MRRDPGQTAVGRGFCDVYRGEGAGASALGARCSFAWWDGSTSLAFFCRPIVRTSGGAHANTGSGKRGYSQHGALSVGARSRTTVHQKGRPRRRERRRAGQSVQDGQRPTPLAQSSAASVWLEVAHRSFRDRHPDNLFPARHSARRDTLSPDASRVCWHACGLRFCTSRWDQSRSHRQVATAAGTGSFATAARIASRLGILPDPLHAAFKALAPDAKPTEDDATILSAFECSPGRDPATRCRRGRSFARFQIWEPPDAELDAAIERLRPVIDHIVAEPKL